MPRTSCRSTPHRWRYRGIVAESSSRSGPRRLPASVQAWFRPTRHPVQTPARRGHGGVASRRVDVVVSQPRSTPPCPQLDVAGTLSEGLPRRFRDTTTDPALADSTCGAPSAALHRSSIVVRGWRYTAAARRRASTATAACRRAATRRASASSLGRAAVHSSAAGDPGYYRCGEMRRRRRLCADRAACRFSSRGTSLSRSKPVRGAERDRHVVDAAGVQL